jgi:hypothetical protein
MMMRVLLAAAVAVTGASALAASSSDNQASASRGERKICTRIQRRGGSRLAYQRVCLTEAEWRERLGNDWRMQLTGRNPEDDVEEANFLSREQATTTYTGGMGESPQ